MGHIEAYCVRLGGGPALRPCCPFVGKGREFFLSFFFLLEIFADFVSHSKSV